MRTDPLREVAEPKSEENRMANSTFKEFPPRPKAASFTVDQLMEKMESSMSDAGR